MAHESGDAEILIPVQVSEEQLRLFTAAAKETRYPVDMFVLKVSADRAGEVMEAVAEGRFQIKFFDDQGREISGDHDPKPDQSE